MSKIQLLRRLTAIFCLTLAVLVFSPTEGWSADFQKGKNLPSCPGSYNKNTWNNCAGTTTYADGSQYFGEWKNGKYHGQGIKTYTDGRIETGKWENNEYIGSEKFRVNSIHELLQAENTRVRFGTQADPSTVTLGPTDGGIPRYPPYDGKNSLNFKMPLMTAVLAPLDLQFVGFKNRSAHYRHNLQPYDDLELCFESVSPEWLGPEFSVPTTKWAGINVGLVLCVYHLHTTPLLRGHLKHEACSIQEKWTGDGAKKGRVYYLDNTHIYSGWNAKQCKPLLGSTLNRGDIIGYSGQVGNNPHVGFRFKIRSTERNPLTITGDPYLHWVQPKVFFNWQCIEPGAIFQPRVLAYPFDCKIVQ